MSNPSAANPQPQDPRDVLSYEMWMLHRTQEQIAVWDANGFKRESEDRHAIYCAAIESFLLHARSLLWFFYRVEKTRDDIVVAQLLDAGSKWNPEPPWVERDWLRPMNKCLQHMTLRREFPAQEWDEKAIRAHIDALFDEFNCCAPRGGPVSAMHPGR